MAQETNQQENPPTARIKELIAVALAKVGSLPCGKLESSVKNLIDGDGTQFDSGVFYGALAEMKKEGQIGYFGVPGGQTIINKYPDPVWYVI